MSITFLGSWKNETTASPLNITISPALAADDFIVAVAATDGGGDTMGGSAPLSTIDVRTSTADAQTSYTAAGKVTGALSLVTLTAAPNACIGGVVAFSGVHKTDPFDAATVSGGSSAAGTVFQLTITTVTPNTMLVFPIGFDTQSTTSPTVVPSDNVSGGLTWGYMPIDTASFQHAGIAYANMPVPGTVTVTLTITNAINAGWGGSLLALKSDGPVATAEQKSFRFRNDDGSETSATWKANLNTPIALAAGTTARLRFLIATVLDRASVGYQLEYKRDTDSLWNAVVAAGTPTLSYGAAGTIGYSAASGTTVAATYPAGITNKSALIMVVGQKPSTANGGTVTTPTGWTLIGSLIGAGGYATTTGADVGNVNVFVYSKDVVTGSETGTVSLTIGTNSVSYANIYRVEATRKSTWSYALTTGSKTTASASVSTAMSSNPGVQAGDFVLAGMVIPTDLTTPAQFSAETLTQTGVTFGTVTEIEEPDSTNGNDIGGFICYAPVTAGTATGVPTLGATVAGTNTNVRGPTFFLRVRATDAEPVSLSPSANIAAAAATATTAQFTSPGGTFTAGRISDDTNPLPAIDIVADGYTELEYALKSVSGVAVDGEVYQFRVSAAGAALTTYTATPSVTVGSGVLPITASATQTDAADTISAAGALGPAAPTITSIDGDNAITSTQTGVVAVVTNAGATQGSSTLAISQGSVSRNQTINSWSQTSINFDVAFDSGAGPHLKFGTATTTLTATGNGTKSISLNPPSGSSYVDVAAPNATAANRIVASPDIVTGDQVQIGNVVGGTISDVTVNNDLRFTTASNVHSFDVRVWAASDQTWGAWATQYMASTADANQTDAPDTLIASGGGTPISASATQTDAPDTFSATGGLLVSAQSNVTDAADTLVASGTIPQPTFVQRSFDLRWSGFNFVTGSRDARWNISTAVSGSRDFRWNLASLMTAQRGLQWSVSNLVARNSDLRWALLQRTSRANDLRWNMVQKTSGSGDIRWDILTNAFVSSVQFRWSLMQRIPVTREIDWAILSAVGRSSDLRWNGLARMSSNGDFRWNTLSRLSNSETLVWNVDVAVGKVLLGLTLPWGIRNSVTQSANARWALLNALQKQETLVWDMRSPLSRALDARWGVLGRVNSQSNIVWNLGETLSRSLDARWNVIQRVNKQNEIDWVVVGKLLRSSDIRWRIVATQLILQAFGE